MTPPRKPSAGKREPLDARTLRAVVRYERARMKRNAHYYPHYEWRLAEAMLYRMTVRAEAIESRAKRKGRNG